MAPTSSYIALWHGHRITMENFEQLVCYLSVSRSDIEEFYMDDEESPESTDHFPTIIHVEKNPPQQSEEIYRARNLYESVRWLENMIRYLLTNIS